MERPLHEVHDTESAMLSTLATSQMSPSYLRSVVNGAGRPYWRFFHIWDTYCRLRMDGFIEVVNQDAGWLDFTVKLGRRVTERSSRCR